MSKRSPVVTVVAIGIGAALFFVLGRFVAIPSPISESLTMTLGMSLGGVPLFTTLKDKSSGESVALSVVEFAFTLRVGLKYSFPAVIATTPHLKTK